ncbi:hypothetical protein [Marinimicrobium sp. ABcell2]|uniref:HzsA-related protein n=1 Tax=Marinimicrobium sp. ABcell2 TaxID=3069751 RepID=UPI0027B2C25E|nr:hypothetical protein [Marinimicrobium sp. ABcell2]MDQ2076629.1 hypothetical protein [Marinimicrobium sp. ABcell2]
MITGWRALSWGLSLALGLGVVACGGGPGRVDEEGNPQRRQQPDPVVVDFAVAYIARPIPREEREAGLGDIRATDLLDPTAFNPGARLYLKDRATATAASRTLTEGAFEPGALYDVKDLSAHPDGNRLLFAMRAPELEDVDEDEQPTWNIWEYDLRLDQLRRVIGSDIRAEAGHDLSPRYLPDGRIVFTSTRQSRSRAILLDDNKPQFDALVENDNVPALLLHVMEDDGTEIEQITYNQSHDLQPSVLQNGRILFTRWDGFNRDRLSLYTVNPDGTDMSFHYGYHSLNGEQAPTLFRPQQMPDGRILAIYKPRDELLGGDMLAIETSHFSENDVDLAGFSGGPAQSSISILPARIDGEISPHGLYNSAYPLHDGSNRLLVSWSQCRLERADEDRVVPCTEEWLATEGLQQAPPLFGLWVYNLTNQTQQPLVLAREGTLYTDALALEPVPAPTYLPPSSDNNSNLVDQGVGILHIQSVYDLDGEDSTSAGITHLADPGQTSAAERPARFLRLIKAVSTPERDVLRGQDDDIFGNRFNQNRGLLEILGYAPIEPDGSVKVRVPADRAFTFDVVNADGARVGARHNNWLQLRAGEVRHCAGCHSADSQLPHGRPDAQLALAYEGASTSGAPFPNTRRTDAFGTQEYPDMGETMAQFDARIALSCADSNDASTCTLRGPRAPSVDLIYDDTWTDPQVRTPNQSFAYRYANLSSDDYREAEFNEDDTVTLEPSPVHAPVAEGCQTQWHSLCRIVINYENHIQPLWERQRWLTEEDEDGERQLALDNEDLPINHTCTSCHSRNDTDGVLRIPAGQLELVRDAAANGQMRSFLELLNNDVELEIVDEALVPRLVETGEYERDEDGELILDDDTGEPIPVLATVTVRPSMSRGGAANSGRFFSTFTTFNEDEGEAVDHRGMLNPHELRLLREWLDLNARYYNNQFDRADSE